MPVNTLRRYKRHYKLQTRPGLNKAQLADVSGNKTLHIDGILPKGPYRHAYAWQIGPFWQDILDIEAQTKWLTFCRHFQMHFFWGKFSYFDENFTKACSLGPVDSKLTLVQVMACPWTDDKPLPEAMLTQFSDDIWCS